MKKAPFFLFIVFLFLFCHKALSQQNMIDSMLNALKTIKQDTGYVNTLNEISKALRNIGDYEQSILYAQKAEKEAINQNFKKGEGKALNNFGLVYMEKGDYNKALSYNIRALKLREEMGDKKGIASSLNNIGLIYHDQGSDAKALEYHFRSLKIKEEIGDKKGISASLGNIGIIYDDQHEYSKALEYHQRSIKIDEEIGNKRGVAASLNNIGIIYKNIGDYSKGLEYFLKAIQADEQLGNKNGKATALNNIGIIYFDQGDFLKAHEYYWQSLKIREEIADKQGIAMSLNNLSNANLGLGNKKLAIEYGTKGLELATEIKSLILVKGANEILSRVYEADGQHKKAFDHYKAFVFFRDSLINEDNTKKIMHSELKFEFEKKEQIAKFVQEKKDALNGEEKQKQKLIRNFLIGGSGILFLFLGIIFIGYQNKKKANELILFQKQEVEKQKHIIEEKQKNILDSIYYAKRIQEALLKEEEQISKHLPEHFVLFKPKDIISGDFYWSLEKQNHLYLAAADCTGHGVPGAMMSMLGIAFLNEINGSEKLLSPAEILNQLRDKIVKELGTSGQTKDGMDISLCKINLESKEVEWAGANNPLWIITEHSGSTKIIEIKADKQPIGYNDVYRPFTNHTFSEKNSIYYLFTDGYADQFGGPHGKKFKYKPLQEKLLNLSGVKLEQQKVELSYLFETWKGKLEQVDDVCMIGLRV